MEYKYKNENIKTIDSIQKIALDIYGKYDLEKSMLWMTEEFGELIKAIRKEKIENVIDEMGDVLAWIFCLSNILDIHVSDAINSTFHKEINRQLNTYDRMKYCEELAGLEIIKDDNMTK